MANGTEHGSRNGSWWRPIIGTVVGFIIGGAVQFMLWSIGERVNSEKVVSRVEMLERAQMQQWDVIKRMDNEGTNASKYGIREERKQIDLNTANIDKLLEQDRKIDVMAEKLSRMDSDIHDLRQHPIK